MTRLLMCAPEFYGVEYEINPWMQVSVPADRDLALRQWDGLYRVLGELGAAIELLDPVPGLPDLSFTANGGYVQGRQVLLSAFRYPQRQHEAAHFERWFRGRGYQVLTPPAGCFFEGEGDALPSGETIFAGYRHRSDIGSHTELGQMTGLRVLSLELTDPRFYHLDTCFAPLPCGAALYYPPAFDEYGFRVIRHHVASPVAVDEALALRFACNAVVVGDTLVVNAGCEELAPLIEPFGLRLRTVDLSEFIKAVGSAKCLALNLE
ncbi:MAG: amidinotransferase [Dehalococcoidia bacterium]|nr:amidinotransferase [Dehalococcoidia bacterium]